MNTKERYIQLCLPETVRHDIIEEEIRGILDRTYKPQKHIWNEDTKGYDVVDDGRQLTYQFEWSSRLAPFYGYNGSTMSVIDVHAWVEVGDDPFVPKTDQNSYL